MNHIFLRRLEAIFYNCSIKINKSVAVGESVLNMKQQIASSFNVLHIAIVIHSSVRLH